MNASAAPRRDLGAGSSGLRADLAGLAIQFETHDRLLAGIFAARFDGFETRPSAALRVTVRAEGDLPSDLPTATAVHAEPHEIFATQQGFVIRGASFGAAADLDQGTIEIVGPPAAYPLDITLRYALPLLLPTALVFHAALLSDGTRTFLCTGPSGAGKSTLAELLPEHALCDEMAVVAPSEAEGWTGRSLPYWRSRPGSGALAGVFLLAHGAHHERRRIPAEHAVHRLAGTVSWPVTDAAAMAAALDRLARLAAQVPVWELSFTPDRGVWPVIAAGVEA